MSKQKLNCELHMGISYDMVKVVLPIRLLALVNGEEGTPHIIDMDDLTDVNVTIERPCVSGVRCVPCVDDESITSYHLSSSNFFFVILHGAEEKYAIIKMTAMYGDTELEATITLVFTPDGVKDATTPVYTIREIAVGQGEPIVPDYKTDMYFDGAERIMVQRTEDGDTEVLDEHETPIVSRKHNGNTVVYDAYQNERVIVSPNGDVAINAGGKHALYVEGEKVYILGVGGFNGVTTAGAQSIDEVLAQ